MAARDRPHIFVPRPAAAEAYRRPAGGGGTKDIPSPSDRRTHADRLSAELEEAVAEGISRRETGASHAEGVTDGVYIIFESFPEIELALESLDPRQGRIHPELVSVQVLQSPDGPVQRATVFVPDGTIGYFLSRLRAYAETVELASPRRRNLVDRIQSIVSASLEALWTDAPELFPEPGTSVWWEVWLRRRDGEEIRRFRAFSERYEVQLGPHSLGFSDRIVVLARATVEQLGDALEALDDLARA